MTITTLQNNSWNKIFFNNARFHGDIGYKIIRGDTILEVETSHGLVYYKLNGSKIGNHTQLSEID